MITIDAALLEAIQNNAMEWAIMGAKVIGLVSFAWIVSGAISRKLNQFIGKLKLDTAVIHLLQSVVHVSLRIGFIVFALNQSGIKMTVVAAILGGLSISLGLALKGNISQVANGILLIVIKPFRSGDYIEVGSVCGTVQKLGLFNATLTTPQNQTVIVPNSQLALTALTNFNVQDTRRIDLAFGLSYDDTMQDAVPVIKAALRNVEGVLPDKDVDVWLTDFGDSSINMSVRVWCNRTEFLQVRHNLIVTLQNVCNENGYSIPYPQRDIHIVEGAPN